MPAEGESTQSAWGTYVNAKRKSDTATHEDDARQIGHLANSGYGQGVMDIAHSGAIGTCDFTQKVITTLNRLNIGAPPPDTAAYWYRNNMGDYRTIRQNPIKSLANQVLVWLEREKRAHQAALSDDFRNASLDNPGYLPVKVAGKGIEKLVTLLGTALLLKRMGLAGAIPAMVAGGWEGYTGDYNDSLMNIIDVPEEELMKNPAYAQLRQEGWSDLDARLEVGNTDAAGEGAMGMLVSAVAALAGYMLRDVTRSGVESMAVKGVQDVSADWIFDNVTDLAKSRLRNQNRNNQP